ncbi:unnamed protein product [marine sediment metagenome]|uniref:4Fe-4S ferredoxin-type domain-containing protein n=1 Tax=marine sediment metagenome TaxID=412755 RepID=X0TAK7_9ZZZZ
MPPKRGTIEQLKDHAAAIENELGAVRSRQRELQTGQAGPVAAIDEEACVLCGACADICPTGAITIGEAAARVDARTCSGCAACVEVCPSEAIELVAGTHAG